MDPVPASTFKTPDERVAGFQPSKTFLRVGATEHRIAKLGSEFTKDAHPEQKRASFGVERSDDLGREVVGDEVVIAPKRANRIVRIVHAAKPESGEEERSRPALGSLVQQLDLGRGEIDALLLDEELIRLACCEGEFMRTQFSELASGT